MIHIEQLRCGPLQIQQWDHSENESHCILGTNGSGKSLFCALLANQPIDYQADRFERPQRVSWVSFESQQQLYEKLLYEDDTDFMDQLDYGTSGLALILESGCEPEQARELAKQFNIEHLLERGYRQFSSGEARKVLLLREVLSKPDLLILDEPFEGLDQQSMVDLSTFCQTLIDQGQDLLLVVNRLDDVQPWCQRIDVLHGGHIITSGDQQQIEQSDEVRQLFHFDQVTIERLPGAPNPSAPTLDRLVAMSQCSVKYGDTVQFEPFNWQVKPGEHWIVTGPNGAGKSTLLQLITGDHPQCYSNDMEVLGFRRGQGESIWDIKKHMGLISPALHQDYRAAGNAITAIVSGLYDSIGLYARVSEKEKQLALRWLDLLGLKEQANQPFRQLSWGQQRMILIARALIKKPLLLILDEPTQGLDDLNRHLVLAFIRQLAQSGETTILFVSHRQDERLDVFEHELTFVPSDQADTRFRVTEAS